MFPIPSYDISAIGILFLVLGSILLVSSIAAARAKWREREDVPFDTVFIQRKLVEETPLGVIVGGTIVSLIFVLVGGFLVIGGGKEVHEFRNLPLERVESIRIQRISTDDPDPRTVSLEDSELIRSGLRTLSGCVQYFRNREKFPNGYKIWLLFDDPSLDGNSLTLRTRDPSLDPPSFVSPHTGGGIDLGDYKCERFEQWVTNNIEPLFTERDQKMKTQ